ncbi:hypothetical protein GCM10027093_19780 [Paraburkholderia jirisanensis]
MLEVGVCCAVEGLAGRVAAFEACFAAAFESAFELRFKSAFESAFKSAFIWGVAVLSELTEEATEIRAEPGLPGWALGRLGIV